MEILKDTCRALTECLCCGSKNLNHVLDLGEQPLANSYLKYKGEPEQVYPLGLNYCEDCTHLQLTHAVNPDLLFKNYLYVSGTTKTLLDYFDSFVALTEGYFPNVYSRKVLDIACNDGSQLDSYKKFGYETYGIDPAENLYELSSKNHKIVCDYLTEESIAKFDTKFDIIIAQNVFAHNTYPKEFLEICKANLNDGGLIFIQTSQANMVEQSQFDTVYHEHISFFNAESMKTLAQRSGLTMINVERTNIHGTSFVFVLSAAANEGEYSLSKETHQSLDIVQKFSENAKNTVSKLNNDIAKYQDKYRIVGYGAAAKGNTVLNFGKIHLDYIVDDNPLKQNMFTPGMKIPIVSLDYINKISKGETVVWIPLSWNFFNEIKQRIQTARPSSDDIFIQLDFTRL